MTGGVVKPQLAQAPLGIVNMSFRNSAIIRVCIAIMRSHRIVQNKGKNPPTFSFNVYNLCFYGVWRRFRAILASFSFSVFLFEITYGEGPYRADIVPAILINKALHD